jgi:hypothetical protein
MASGRSSGCGSAPKNDAEGIGVAYFGGALTGTLPPQYIRGT